MMPRSFQLAGQGCSDTSCIGEDNPACRDTILSRIASPSDALPPDRPIKQVVVGGLQLLHLTERQQPYTQAIEIGDRTLHVVVNLNIDHLRIVFLDAPQLGVHPRFVDPVLIAAITFQRDGQVGLVTVAPGLPHTIKHERIGVQTRIQKRRVHHVLRICQAVRKPYFRQRFILTEVQFLNAPKARSILKPELVQSVIEIGDRQCLLATLADLPS